MRFSGLNPALDVGGVDFTPHIQEKLRKTKHLSSLINMRLGALIFCLGVVYEMDRVDPSKRAGFLITAQKDFVGHDNPAPNCFKLVETFGR